jgi:hypothetical protein
LAGRRRSADARENSRTSGETRARAAISCNELREELPCRVRDSSMYSLLASVNERKANLSESRPRRDTCRSIRIEIHAPHLRAHSRDAAGFPPATTIITGDGWRRAKLATSALEPSRVESADRRIGGSAARRLEGNRNSVLTLHASRVASRTMTNADQVMALLPRGATCTAAAATCRVPSATYIHYPPRVLVADTGRCPQPVILFVRRTTTTTFGDDHVYANRIKDHGGRRGDVGASSSLLPSSPPPRLPDRCLAVDAAFYRRLASDEFRSDCGIDTAY